MVFLLSRERSAVTHRTVPEVPPAKRATQTTNEAPPATPSSESALSPEAEKPRETPAPASESRTVESKTPAPSSAMKPVTGPVSVLSPGVDGPLGGITLDSAGGAADGQLVLDLEATELSWVVVQIDNGSPQEALLRPGEKGQWKGQDQFTLTLGNAGGVKAFLNGKPQKAFGPSGKVAREIVLKR
jgi:hypothetical protein